MSLGNEQRGWCFLSVGPGKRWGQFPAVRDAWKEESCPWHHLPELQEGGLSWFNSLLVPSTLCDAEKCNSLWLLLGGVTTSSCDKTGLVGADMCVITQHIPSECTSSCCLKSPCVRCSVAQSSSWIFHIEQNFSLWQMALGSVADCKGECRGTVKTGGKKKKIPANAKVTGHVRVQASHGWPYTFPFHAIINLKNSSKMETSEWGRYFQLALKSWLGLS